MKLFFFATNRGVYRFLFAESEQRAVEMFSLYLIITEMPPTKFWVREMTVEQLFDPHREPLQEALSRGIEGVGHYVGNKQWRIRPLDEEFSDGSA